MSARPKPIDTPRFAAQLRAQAIDVEGERVLISRLAGSGQEADLTLPANCNGYGRVRHFHMATAEGCPPIRCRSRRRANRSASAQCPR